ncbi:MAG TPA: rod shape-determining protein MreD [Gaiellaceae bacterium]|nr:rod shape-determining protein MreD [Gaiellaceae bacterium]
MTQALRVAVLVFLATVLQASLVSSVVAFGGSPDLLLLVLVGVALLCGAITGAVAGFGGGLLLDVLTLDTLGVTALVLALAGYFTGRYGETTGRDRGHAPIVAVVVATALVLVFGFLLHFLIGEAVSARRALLEALLPTIGLNLLLGAPVLALCRFALRRSEREGRVAEVQLLG